MGKNPLIGGGDGGRGRDNGKPPLYDPNDLFGSAARLNNLTNLCHGERWHYVKPANESDPEMLSVITGPEAADIWAFLDNGNLNHKGWAPARIEGLQSRLLWLISRGREHSQ